MSVDASLVVRCDCNSPEHMMVFDARHWDASESFPAHSELYAHVQLDADSAWWRRLGLGLQFIIRGRCKKWMWSDTVINDAEAKRLRDFLTEYLANSRNAPR